MEKKVNPVSENIRKIRLEKKISVTELAEKIGVSQVTMTEIEKGIRAFTYQRLNEIADALDVKVDKLVPPYIDIGRCVKMPLYTETELSKLEMDWEQNLQRFDYEEKQSVKKHTICSINIDTSEFELSDIPKIDDYVQKLSYLNKFGYSSLQSVAEKLLDNIYTENAYEPLKNNKLAEALAEIKDSKSEYDYLINNIAEILGELFF